MDEQNTIRKILRNEVTWVVVLFGILWGFVTTVVLPLKTLQIQVAQVQTDLTAQNKKYDNLDKVVNILGNRTTAVETRLDNLKK